MAYDKTKVVDDINEIDSETKKGCLLFIEECKKRNLDIRIFETYRPQERQDYLYEQGRTRSGSKVTWTKSSYHTTRRAFDVIHRTLLWNAPESFWKGIAEVGKMFGFNCGYYWTKQDKPHFQLDKGKSIVIPSVSNSVNANNSITMDKKGVVTASVLNVRSGGSTSFPIIGKLSQGQEVSIAASSNGWYQIVCGNIKGWVSAEFVKLQEVIKPSTPTVQQPVKSNSGFHYGVDAKNNVAVMAFKPEFLDIVQENKPHTQIKHDIWVNGTFFYNNSPTTICGVKGKVFRATSKDNGYKDGAMYYSPTQGIKLARINSVSELPSDWLWVNSGIILQGDGITYSPDSEGYRKGKWSNGTSYDFTDVLRATAPKTFMGYNSKDGYLRLFVTTKPCTQENIFNILKAYNCDKAIQLDGGGSCNFVAEGKKIVQGDGRKLNTILIVK